MKEGTKPVMLPATLEESALARELHAVGCEAAAMRPEFDGLTIEQRNGWTAIVRYINSHFTRKGPAQ